MNKITPDLGYFLAEHAVKARYQYRHTGYDLNALAEFCQHERQHPGIYCTWMKMQRERINQIIVEVVKMSLSPLHQKFMYYRYHEKRNFDWIEARLPISQTQLFRLNKNILEDVKSLLSYSLSADDIFYRLKVINMLHIIDFRISTFCNNTLVPVDRELLNYLQCRRNQYRQLLDIMQNCIAAKDENKYNYVVAMKLTYPEYNVSELALQCQLSPATISKKLRKYMRITHEYIR